MCAYNEPPLVWVAILSAVILTFFRYLFVHKWNYYDVAVPGRCLYRTQLRFMCKKVFSLEFYLCFEALIESSPWVYVMKKMWTHYHSCSVQEQTIKKSFLKLTRIPTFFLRELIISLLFRCQLYFTLLTRLKVKLLRETSNKKRMLFKSNIDRDTQ